MCFMFVRNKGQCLLEMKGKEVREVGQVADEQIVSIISQH